MSLSLVQSLRLAAALEDCSDKLEILECSLTVQIRRARESLAEKERARLIKLRKICHYIQQQVSKLHVELEEKQTFSSILQVVEEEELKRADRLQEEAERELIQRRKQNLQKQQKEVEEKTQRLRELCLVAEDLRRQAQEQAEEAYRRKTLEEDSEQQLQHAKMLLANRVKLVQRQMLDEKNVHEECKVFLHNQHKELQGQLHQWRHRTETMLQEKTEELASLLKRRAEVGRRLLEMRDKFKEMEEFVIEDRKAQEKLRRQREKVRAALRVQAWWKGYKVRKEYRALKAQQEDKKK